MDNATRPTLIHQKKPRWRKIVVRMVLVLVGLPLLFALWSFFTLPQQFLGSHTLALIRTATRVETFRFKDVEPKDEPTKWEIKDYPIEAQGQLRDKEVTNQLAEVLLNSRTYMGFNDCTCLIEPSVGFRLWSGRECVEVIVCRIGQMLITTKNETGHVTHTAYTEFYYMRPAMTKLAREAFPHDLVNDMVEQAP